MSCHRTLIIGQQKALSQYLSSSNPRPKGGTGNYRKNCSSSGKDESRDSIRSRGSWKAVGGEETSENCLRGKM